MHGTDVATADDLVLLSSVAAITVSAPPAEHAAAATSTAAATTTTTSTATATATPTTTAAMPTSTKPQHGRPNTLGRMGLTDSFDLMPGFKPFDLKPTKRSDSPAPSDVVLHPPLASPTPPKSPPHQVPARVVEHRVSESDEDLPPLCTAVPCSSPTSPNCAINYKQQQQQQHQRTGELHEEADESESDDDASGDDEEEHDGEQNDDDDDGDEEDQDFCFENQADDDDDDDDDDNCDLGYSDTPSPHLRRFSLVEEDSWSSSDEEATGDANEGEYQGDSDSDSDSSQDPGYSSDSDDSVVVFATEDDDESNDGYDGNTAALPHAPLLPFWYSHEEPFQIRAIHAMYSAQLLPPRSIYSREPPAFIATIQRRLLMSTGDELQTLDHVAVYYREPVDPGKPMRRRSTATALTTWDQLDGLPTRIELTTECQRRHLERTRLAPGPASDLICLPDFYSSEDYVFSVSNNRESRCMPVSYSPATLRHPYPPALLPSRRDTDGDGDDDEDGEFVDGVGLIHA